MRLSCTALLLFAALSGCPLNTLVPGDLPGGAEGEDGPAVDDGDACISGQRSQGPSESCCLDFGADACGANLFCAVFDGRSVPTCYVEHTRLDGETCRADVNCASGSCAETGICRASPGQPCSREVGCAVFQNEDYVCAGGVGESDRCLIASRSLGGVCIDDDGCDSGYCAHDRCSSGADGADCAVDDDCASAHCVDNGCTSGSFGASCLSNDDCDDDLVCSDNECRERTIGDQCTTDAQCASSFSGCFDGACAAQSLGAACDSNPECGLNTCVEGTCTDTCDISLQCEFLGIFGGVSQECRDGRCVDVGDIGDACTIDTDCSHDVFGDVCASGTCRQIDGRLCAADDECASDACEAVVRDRCVNLDGEAGATCTVTADCHANEQCRPRSVQECVAP